ncbi:MAG: hypothetical protein DRR19_31740 [Candidatus Parabeggiatoa sp. nov. 1]|nr:MAG: hypothetical protein DRR19_31740 [Gammaproteobacteria bacterium]
MVKYLTSFKFKSLKSLSSVTSKQIGLVFSKCHNTNGMQREITDTNISKVVSEELFTQRTSCLF